MAIKERKQITGTEAQIKGFAGHNGVLAYATDTKHLHVLSGTAGTTTELANRTDIPDITGKADKTELTTGLAGKANSSHTHTKSQITDFPTIPDVSTMIPKTGNRGALAGWDTNTVVSDTALTEIRGTSPDVIKVTADKTVQIQNGNARESWTKVIYIAAANVQVNLAGQWYWVGSSTPTIEKFCMIVLHWNDTRGYANVLKGGS